MSFSAAVAGYIVSIGTTVAGLALGPEKDGIVNLNYQLLPVILKVLIRPFLGVASVSDQADPFADPMNIAFPANPILVGGICGIIITSLSLLPIGRLDGGVLARASVGSQAAGSLALFAWALLLTGSFAPDEAGNLYLAFGICTIFFQNTLDLPPREAISDVDGTQKGLGIALVALAFLLNIPGWAFPTV